MSKIIPVILCGGEGARLWPVSHRERPKIFLEMADGRTLLRHSMDRARLFADAGAVFAITNEASAEPVGREWDDIATNGQRLQKIIEPCRCNTGPALASAALVIAKEFGSDAIIVSLPADHLITDEATLAAQIEIAKSIAALNEIVIFGVKPHAPLTNYGYVEHKLGRVEAFHEKPDAVTAKSYLRSGQFLWNAGLVVATAGTVIKALERHAPKLLNHCKMAMDAAQSDVDDLLLDELAYERCPVISFDHAVLEKADNVHVLEAQFDWRDVGNWEQMGQMVPPDSDGNHVSGNATLFDTANCIVRAGHRPVGIIGLDNVVVVDSPDGLLVVHTNAVEHVKSLFADRFEFAEAAPAPQGFNETAAGAFQEKP